MPEPTQERRPFLTREQLDRLQRARLLDAVAAVVAELGYAEATIADVVAHAGLSRRTFYELFDNKADAFFAAYDDVIDRVLRRMETACVGDARTEERVLAGLAELLRLVDRHPAWARMCVLEAPAASAVTGDRARHLRPVARWVARVQRELGLDARLDPVAHAGMVLGGLHASMLSPERRPETLLSTMFRLAVGRDSPDLAVPTLIDGDPARAARVTTALRPPVDLSAAIAHTVDAIADHDPWSLGAADDASARVLARRVPAPRLELLLLRHLVAAAIEGGPAGALNAIGHSRNGDATNLSALRCLYHLAEQPGSSGRDVGAALGMRDTGVSRLLGQLRDRGDVRGEGGRGGPKRWELTAAGRARLVPSVLGD